MFSSVRQTHKLYYNNADAQTLLQQSIRPNFTTTTQTPKLYYIVIIISKLLKRYSKAKLTMAPAYSRTLKQRYNNATSYNNADVQTLLQQRRRLNFIAITQTPKLYYNNADRPNE